MTALFALITVLAWGSWIPVAQAVPGVPQRTRTFYATLGNVVFATAYLLVLGGHVTFGWRAFWLPFAGGVVWTAGNYSAFRASEAIGLARAAGSWTPLNIIVAFAWGAALFGELEHVRAVAIAGLAGGLVLVFAGVLLVARSEEVAAEAASERRPRRSGHRSGFAWAGAAGVLWGSYFVPAQWAKVSSQVSNFPLALGIVAGGAALAALGRDPVRLAPRAAAAQLAAGMLFGIGNAALLRLVTRVGTGVGFTIAQLSLLVNASVGVFVFKVPPPGSRAARIVFAGVVIAGVGGVAIGLMR